MIFSKRPRLSSARTSYTFFANPVGEYRPGDDLAILASSVDPRGIPRKVAMTCASCCAAFAKETSYSMDCCAAAGPASAAKVATPTTNFTKIASPEFDGLTDCLKLSSGGTVYE